MSLKIKVYNQSVEPVKDLELSDKIFGVKAREEWRADQCKVAEQHHQAGNWHVFPQATHLAHILLMVHS